MASKNLRVNAYITPDEVDEYFKVISVDGAAVSKDAYTSMDDLKEKGFLHQHSHWKWSDHLFREPETNGCKAR